MRPSTARVESVPRIPPSLTTARACGMNASMEARSVRDNCQSPSPMMRRERRAETGFVGQFLAVATNLRQDGRSYEFLTLAAPLDWWPLMVDTELAGSDQLAVGKLDASISTPTSRREFEPMPAESEDWWADLVQAEFTVGEQGGTRPSGGANSRCGVEVPDDATSQSC